MQSHLFKISILIQNITKVTANDADEIFFCKIYIRLHSHLTKLFPDHDISNWYQDNLG